MPVSLITSVSPRWSALNVMLPLLNEPLTLVSPSIDLFILKVFINSHDESEAVAVNLTYADVLSRPVQPSLVDTAVIVPVLLSIVTLKSLAVYDPEYTIPLFPVTSAKPSNTLK